MINLRVCVKIIKSYVNFLLLPPLRAKQSEAKLSNYSTNFVRVSLQIVIFCSTTRNHFLFFLRIFFFGNSVDNLEITYV